ncbi:MAG: arginine--tRNA ligase [Synergistaceae bacterium]|nr:arginine--tRNA ligase [Synergistaceae bacterium]
MESILLRASEDAAQRRGCSVPELAQLVQIERPKREGQGDRASGVAMRIAKALSASPRELAEEIVASVSEQGHGHSPSCAIAKVEVAGPGFINFFLSDKWRENVVAEVLAKRESYGASDRGAGRRVQVEFVSANPTGPLHIGHGRGAAVGDVLANLLAFTGWNVEREYYINDAGLQMEILGKSVQARYLELLGQPAAFPENGYKGEYIVDLARAAKEGGQVPQQGDSLPWFKRYAADSILGGIKDDLARFGVKFDVWFPESELYKRGLVAEAMQQLKDGGHAYEADGALWFKTSDFIGASDEDDESKKDRVLIRANGVPTYFASDIAYHRDKYERGFDRVIDIWGADHHGYVPRMRAAVESIGRSRQDFDVILIQLVSLLRDGVQVAMSTRAGEFVTLRDVLDEVGTDATRYFFLTRRADSQLEFDLELAKREGSDNPVYYIQYAHARICSVMREAAERGVRAAASAEVFADRDARALLDSVSAFPAEIDGASKDLAPHVLTAYALSLAGRFHAFYNTNRILGEAPSMEAGRLALVEAVKVVLSNCLRLLGVTAPEKM